MSRLIELTPRNGKPTYFDSDEIYGIERASTGGGTLILAVVDVIESYDEVKQKMELASVASA